MAETNAIEDEVAKCYAEMEKKAYSGVCPNCSYCPCCGRRYNDWHYPYTPYQPYYWNTTNVPAVVMC